MPIDRAVARGGGNVFRKTVGHARVIDERKPNTKTLSGNVDADEKKRVFAMAGAFEEIPNPEFQNHRTPVPSDG